MAEKDLELFSFPSSYYSSRALMALAEKNLAYKEVFIDLDLLENHSLWYMKINPAGQVPTLRCGDKYIADSPKIIACLDDNFGEPLLLPSEPKQTKETVEQFVDKIDSIDIPVLTYGGCYYQELLKNPLTPGFILNRFKAKVDNKFLTKTLEAELALHPEMAHVYEPKIANNKVVLARMKNKSKVVEELERAASVLRDVEDQLKRVGFSKDSTIEGWLVGPNFTYADISLGVLFGRLFNMGYADALWENGKLPLVSEYFEQMKKRPSYNKVVVAAYSSGMMFSILSRKMTKKVKPYIPIVGAACVGALAYYFLT